MFSETGAPEGAKVDAVGAAPRPERRVHYLSPFARIFHPIGIAALTSRRLRPAELHMRVRRRLVRLALAYLAWFSAVTGATGLTVDEFDALNTLQREDTILTVLEFYYENYRADVATSRKADCMATKHRIQAEDGNPYLVNRIMGEMEAARANMAGSRTVEEVVETVVERECAAP